MNWTATVTKHNDDNLTMDVVYEREGYDPITVGVMLPTEGADLAQHLAAYVPTVSWEWQDEAKLKRFKPEVGLKVSAPPPREPQVVEAIEPPTIRLEPVQ